MSESNQRTRVIIIGAGVAGLTLGNLLLRNGVDCVVLEKHTREYADQRQRGGTVDTFGVRMFQQWGLGEVVTSDDSPDVTSWSMYIDGEQIPFDFDDDDDDRQEAVFIPQQVLVRNLHDAFLRNGGDLRYGSEVLPLTGLEGTTPVVQYRDAAGTTHTLTSDLIAGCDGFHGISRASVPQDALTCYSREYGYAWLTMLADVASTSLDTAVHERGYAASIPRGTRASRLYLQVPLHDRLESWTDDRIWGEIDTRFGKTMTRGAILDKRIVPLRSVVYDPMNYGPLYLLGDAAHIVPPMSAKGIHLALHDAQLFARAVLRSVTENDPTALESYSEAALEHIWIYQTFAAWTTDVNHDAGDPSYAGDFRKQIARAELRRLATSPTANRLYGEFIAGVN
ncbi:4-hydroxybenzoate 3-monooxygenase [Agreia sp.]|uniref:4-hydroxybenzoate 3-monooxygenase n=1 Tax=Agreia sp. TaxID=1872416 RepID=UPI0035BC6A81